ncbi:hypothetical protein DICA1_D04698 [Diutina catenulata]
MADPPAEQEPSPPAGNVFQHGDTGSVREASGVTPTHEVPSPCAVPDLQDLVRSMQEIVISTTTNMQSINEGFAQLAKLLQVAAPSPVAQPHIQTEIDETCSRSTGNIPPSRDSNHGTGIMYSVHDPESMAIAIHPMFTTYSKLIIQKLPRKDDDKEQIQRYFNTQHLNFARATAEGHGRLYVQMLMRIWTETGVTTVHMDPERTLLEIKEKAIRYYTIDRWMQEAESCKFRKDTVYNRDIFSRMEAAVKRVVSNKGYVFTPHEAASYLYAIFENLMDYDDQLGRTFQSIDSMLLPLHDMKGHNDKTYHNAMRSVEKSIIAPLRDDLNRNLAAAKRYTEKGDYSRSDRN